MKQNLFVRGQGRGYSGLARVFTIMALLLFVSTGAWATTVELDIQQCSEANLWDNGSLHTTINLDQNISATVTASDANSGKFYQSGYTWRLYQTGSPKLTINAAEGYVLSAVTVTYEVSNAGVLLLGTDQIASGTEVTASGQSIEFSVGNTGGKANGQVRITKISVTYSGGDSGSGGGSGAGYTVSLKDGVKDADKWTVKVGEGQAQALPIGGLKGDGTETVTLLYNGRLKVKGVKATSDAAPAAVPVTAITLNKTETSIKVGATEMLSVTSVLPEEATDKTYTWKTSDETKATVDQDGKVTAVAEGTVTIYAEANDGSGVKGNCAVTVTPAIITVTINHSDWGIGDSFTKDGVTVSAGSIDPMDGNLMGDGTFSTTLGNFTKIEVTCEGCEATGTGWSGNFSKKTWAGTPASTVNFNGNFMGMGMGITIVCTIVPTN